MLCISMNEEGKIEWAPLFKWYKPVLPCIASSCNQFCGHVMQIESRCLIRELWGEVSLQQQCLGDIWMLECCGRGHCSAGGGGGGSRLHLGMPPFLASSCSTTLTLLFDNIWQLFPHFDPFWPHLTSFGHFRLVGPAAGWNVGWCSMWAPPSVRRRRYPRVVSVLPTPCPHSVPHHQWQRRCLDQVLCKVPFWHCPVSCGITVAHCSQLSGFIRRPVSDTSGRARQWVPTRYRGEYLRMSFCLILVPNHHYWYQWDHQW